MEDIPADLSESGAASLLHAVAFAWHPALLAASRSIPRFQYADIHELPADDPILLVPECAESWLGADWTEQLAGRAGCLLHGLSEREEWTAAVAAAFSEAVSCDADLLADFLSLGLAWYLVMSLSRRMHYFIDPDEVRLFSAAQTAARAGLAGDTETARRELEVCFECLLETREQLFPVPTHLVELCLPGDSDEIRLSEGVADGADRLTWLLSGSDLERLSEQRPESFRTLSEAVDQGRCCVVCGGFHELRISSGTLSAVWSDLRRAADVVPGTKRLWGRARFGLCHSLPQLLSLFQIDFALHAAFDDGLYPERESGWFRWQGPGAAEVAASSRLPVAADSAVSFLRLPERLAETMQQDTVPSLLLARLPELKTPWLNDLRRIHRRTPLIGHFTTLADLVQEADPPAEAIRFHAGEYLSPHLIQASVLATEDPLTGPAELYRVWNHLERLRSLTGLMSLAGRSPARFTDPVRRIEQRLQDLEAERLRPGTVDRAEQKAAVVAVTDDILQNLDDAADTLASLFPSSEQQALLLINPLLFPRDVSVKWPFSEGLPRKSDAVRSVWTRASDIWLRCRVPPGGIVCVEKVDAADGAAVHPETTSGRPLAESGVLRNRWFEVLVSPDTGGIAEVRFHGRRANRVSQYVAFRYESPRNIPETDDRPASETAYAHTVCTDMTVMAADCHVGIIRTACEIRDVSDDRILARFHQTVQVDRMSPRVRITVQFDPDSGQPVRGNPWMTYLACRFAWDNEAAAITRGLLGQACGFRGERFETADYIEVADEDHRLLIVPHGLPCHRRSGHRMLDSLLAVENQPLSGQRFDFTLEFDQPWPMRTVLDVLQPVLTRPSSVAGPRSSWIIGLTAKNVQAARMAGDGSGVDLLLYETEGRPASCAIRTARTPLAAVEQTGIGEDIQPLEIRDGGVRLDFRPFDIRCVRLMF